MKINGIKFVYRGTDQSAGKLLAHLLEEISVEYTIGEDVADPSGNGITHVNADLGALLRTLDERVSTKPKAQADKMAKRAAEERAEREKYTTTTPIPPVHVRDRNVLQWLRAMNVPIGAPITLQFVDDLTSRGISFDRDPDATEMRRRGALVVGTPDHRGTGC
jgi:hypothetical protein